MERPISTISSSIQRLLLRECGKILEYLRSRNDAASFLEPVDVVGLGLLDYPSVVTHPMDLGTISARFQSSFYETAQAFYDDCRLVYRNAMLYNPPGTLLHRIAAKTLVAFEKRWEEHIGRAEGDLGARQRERERALAARSAAARRSAELASRRLISSPADVVSLVCRFNAQPPADRLTCLLDAVEGGAKLVADGPSIAGSTRFCHLERDSLLFIPSQLRSATLNSLAASLGVGERQSDIEAKKRQERAQENARKKQENARKKQSRKERAQEEVIELWKPRSPVKRRRRGDLGSDGDGDGDGAAADDVQEEPQGVSETRSSGEVAQAVVGEPEPTETTATIVETAATVAQPTQQAMVEATAEPSATVDGQVSTPSTTVAALSSAPSMPVPVQYVNT